MPRRTHDPYDPPSHRRAFAGLPVGDRRRIIKAVNRGRGLDDRREARFAVGVALQQQRFWSKAWLIGPAIALFQWDRGWLAVALNAVVATLVVGGTAYVFHRRAARALRANEDVVGRGSARKRHPKQDGPD